MRNVREIGRRVINPVDIARHGIIGLFSKAVSGQSVPSKRAIAEYLVRSFELAEWGARETIGALDTTLSELVRGERERAYADMRVDSTEAHTARSPSTTALHDRIAAELRLFAAEGGRLLSQFNANTALFMIAGHSPQTAMLLVANSMATRRQRWMDGRVGAGHAISHRVYLAVCEALQQTSCDAYLGTASNLGAEVFELTELGRTPKHFTLETIPAERLHPQSTAVIKVAR